jgi:predicted dehydrogenase
MTRKVKIFGAGSIGNHLSHASRRLGWAVDICDIDPAALARTKAEIYPARYGKWDEAIGLYEAAKVPKGGYDFIFIGTPPDSHITLARAAIAEKPKALLIEKPLCTPDLSGADELRQEASAAGVAVFVGYDHAVGRAAARAGALVESGDIGRVLTIDVEFREYWGGIFAAHPWLDGPADSYLGYWRRGGGAAGEHSHAINLWQYFAARAGVGRVASVQESLSYVRQGKADYDELCLLHLKTHGGLLGRVVQDVVTQPPRKWARIQGTDGFVEWHCGFEPGVDLVRYQGAGKEAGEIRFHKTRPDDFITELAHIDAALEAGTAAQSALALDRGLESMLVVAAAHKSAETGGLVSLDPAKGFNLAALSAL